jgi:hypothetical protein
MGPKCSFQCAILINLNNLNIFPLPSFQNMGAPVQFGNKWPECCLPVGSNSIQKLAKNEYFAYFHIQKVTRIDHTKKRLFYVENGGDDDEEAKMLTYDALINSSPIDQFVENTQICAPLRLEHNKVI